MPGPRILPIARSVCLVLLLGFFVGSLLVSLRRERGDLFGPQASGQGQDPGVRVLLTDRGERNEAHGDLAVLVLQPCTLACPENATWNTSLPPGSRLALKPDPTGGLVIFLPNSNEQLRWSGPEGRAQRIVLSPQDKSAQATDPVLYEASDHMPVFSLLARLNDRPGERSYRGNLEVTAVRGRWLYAVNLLPIEAYVDSVLQGEMDNSFPQQALRAQAVAARGFAYARASRPVLREEGLVRFDLADVAPDPVYQGTGRGGPSIAWAVKDTRGIILAVQGAPFAPYFHAASGGRTAGVADFAPQERALDGTPVSQVMPSMDDPWCERGIQALDKWQDTHWKHSVTLIPAQIRAILKKHGESVTWVTKMTADPPDGKRRIASVTFTTNSRAEVTLDAYQFLRLAAESGVTSTLWGEGSPRKRTAEGEVGTVFDLEIFGRGHGVGMSQVSAYAMAQAGWKFREILAYFYHGAELVRRW